MEMNQEEENLNQETDKTAEETEVTAETEKTETVNTPETAYQAADTTGGNLTQADTQPAPNYQIEEDLLAAAEAAMG